MPMLFTAAEELAQFKAEFADDPRMQQRVDVIFTRGYLMGAREVLNDHDRDQVRIAARVAVHQGVLPLSRIAPVLAKLHVSFDWDRPLDAAPRVPLPACTNPLCPCQR